METLMTEISKILDSKNEEIKTLKWRIESLEAKLKEYEKKAAYGELTSGSTITRV